MTSFVVLEIKSCSEGRSCRNSIDNRGVEQSSCASCRLAPGGEDNTAHYWAPKGGAKHPTLEKEKIVARRQKQWDRQRERLSKDKTRSKINKKATLAEKRTQDNIIKATINSGRSNKDGDHVSAGTVTLDTKLQTKRENPIVLLHELEKVRGDARRSGYSIGGLVLRTKSGVGVVVLHESDYAILIKLLIEQTEKTSETK
jgi:hypothetical protein